MAAVFRVSVLRCLLRTPRMSSVGIRLLNSAITNSQFTVARRPKQSILSCTWISSPTSLHFSTVGNPTNANINRSQEDRYGRATSGEIDESKIFVGMLNFKTDENTLKEYFSKYGEVESVTVARAAMSNRSKGYGFVHFKDPQSLRKALEDRHNLDGRDIKVNTGTDMHFTALYLPELPAGVSKDQLQEYFSQFGTLRAVDFIRDKETRELSHVYVKFYTQEDAAKALQPQMHQIGQHQIEVRRSRSRMSNVVSSKKIYVKGLPTDTTVDKVKAYFEKFGLLTGIDVNVFHDKDSGKREIIAFVSFSEAAFAEKVVNKENHLVDGANISLRLATDSRITKRHSLKVSVEDFPSNVTQQDLVEYFENFGPLDKVFMVSQKLLPLGVKEAVVQFQFSRAVDTVMQYKDHMIHGEPIKVRQLGWRPPQRFEKKQFEKKPFALD